MALYPVPRSDTLCAILGDFEAEIPSMVPGAGLYKGAWPECVQRFCQRVDDLRI